MTFIHPATIIVSGGTGSGKTVLTRNILSHHEATFIGLPPSPRVLWCFGITQPLFSIPIDNVDIRYHEGLADLATLKEWKPDIMIIDDLIEKSNDTFLHNLFVKISHHMAISVFYITQNLYEKGQVKMKRNAHYIVMMRNPSDKSQITTLGRQLYPRRKCLLEHFYESYDDATNERFGYLVIDVSPQSSEKQKLKTNIIPDVSGRLKVIVYQPK